MAGIAHLSFGFAGKWISSKIPLFILLIASELLDILWAIFWLIGIENITGAPWSHGFLMSIIWSMLAAFVIIFIYRNAKSGITVGIVVFSHWILDFITHPMGAVMNGEPLSPDLYLVFYNSPKVGLGLYNQSKMLAYIFEFTLFGIGIISYIIYTRIYIKRKNNCT
jgi:hypothetical protein